jgi:hypothetical protein
MPRLSKSIQRLYKQNNLNTDRSFQLEKHFVKTASGSAYDKGPRGDPRVTDDRKVVRMRRRGGASYYTLLYTMMMMITSLFGQQVGYRLPRLGGNILFCANHPLVRVSSSFHPIYELTVIAVNTSHTLEEGAHGPSWPNGLIIIIRTAS